MSEIAIIGSAGIPARYGGFETLAENLVRHHAESRSPHRLTVYCSGADVGHRSRTFLLAELKYVRVPANGPFSVIYDIWCALSAWRGGARVLLVLGVSGAVVLPLLRLFSRMKIVTNVDGVEWRRAKWRGLGRLFLRLSERIAVRSSHVVIADNEGIAAYLKGEYGCEAQTIAYGGDHAVAVEEVAPDGLDLPAAYALGICRIEPENNIEMILRTFANGSPLPLVMIGNWDASQFGRALFQRFQNNPNTILVGPIYDLGKLRYLRSRARLYVHGHSAGGTNPSLVEMMHFGVPIVAFDCDYNRHTMQGTGAYFNDEGELRKQVLAARGMEEFHGRAIQATADRYYRWSVIGREYFALFDDEATDRL